MAIDSILNFPSFHHCLAAMPSYQAALSWPAANLPCPLRLDFRLKEGARW